MATHHLPKFTNPDWLKSVDGERLKKLFAPYEVYLGSRGFSFPHPPTDGVDYEALASIVVHPDENVPREMIEALYYLHEMSGAEQMDELLTAARAQGLEIDANAEVTPADVAVQVWLLHPDLLRERHAEAYAVRQKSYTYFAGREGGPRSFRQPAPDTLARLEADLDLWFGDNNRGRGCRVFVFDQGTKILIAVRHGLPYRREGSRRDGKSTIEFYRPEIHDVLIYDPEFDEIGVHVHSRTVSERKLYLATIGEHLFGDARYFPVTDRFTLAPLLERGVAALACEDVPALESIKLVEFQRFWGGAYKEIEVRKATDIFAIFGADGRASLAGGALKRAVFAVKMKRERKARKVTIRPPNIAVYDRDSDSEPVEVWLRRQGFIIDQASEPDADTEEVVVGPRDNTRSGGRAPGMEANP